MSQQSSKENLGYLQQLSASPALSNLLCSALYYAKHIVALPKNMAELLIIMQFGHQCIL
jgi:hypothetical protein